MTDHYSTVTRTGCLGNIMNSLVGALVGLGLFLGSFALLWYNEGRVNLAIIAQDSVPISATAAQPALEGKLVAATGTLASKETLGDTFLHPGDYLMLQRVVEMYAWEEDSRSTTTKNRDGSSTTRTTYSYDTEWTSDPEDSSSFRQESGHHNPPMSTEGARWTVGQAALGLYAVAPATLTMPDVQQLSLNGDIVRAEKGWHLEHNFLVDRPNALSSPQVGDLRISYYAVPNRIDVTLFGRVQGDRIEPYVAKGATLYRAFTANREQAIATMNTEYTIMLWVLRLVGFLMMWIGMYASCGPLNALLDLVPVVGTISNLLLALLLLPAALTLSITTIVISMLAHQPLLLIVVVALVFGGVIVWSRMRQPGSAALPAA